MLLSSVSGNFLLSQRPSQSHMSHIEFQHKYHSPTLYLDLLTMILLFVKGLCL